MNAQHKEARTSKRVSVLLKGSYRINESDFPFSVMTAVNISETGICFVTDELVPAGHSVELNIVLPSNESLALFAKTIWSFQLSQSNLFRTGLKILHTDSAEFKKFKAFYEERLLYPPQIN